MKKKSFKEFLRKFWYIVWKDESFKGWIISILFVFIIIKFIFFPVLSVATGTQLPLAIVESCSMYHDNNIFSNYKSWWDRHEEKYSKENITNDEFKKFKFKKGFSKGDILFITGVKPEKIKKGDVIIFNGGSKNPIIHRIIKVNEQDKEYIFSTMGDNNNGQLEVEKKITQEQIMGKARFRILPWIGWGKLIFYEKFRPEYERGFCAEN